jgi:8-oxo-dGTP diphosphatase
MLNLVSSDQLTSVQNQARSEGVKKFVVGIILINNDSVLFLKRASDEFMANALEFPGGGLEEGESLIDCVCRELLEETNLVVSEVSKFVDYFDYQSQSGKKTRQFNFLVKAEGDINLSDEHQSAEWFPISSIPNILEIDMPFKKSLNLL